MTSLQAAQLKAGAFFGRSRRVTHVSDMILSETHYASAMNVPRHLHERAYFGLLLEGGYREDLGKGVVDFQPSSVVFHPPREVRCGDIGGGGATLFHAELPNAWIERLAEHGPVPGDAHVHDHGPMVRLAVSLYREFRMDDAGAALVAEGLVLEMLGLLVRMPRKEPGSDAPPRWLRDAVELVHGEFAAPLTVAAVAERIGVGPVHLARTFRRHRGESIGQCVRRLRVRHARLLLDDGAGDLATVALDAGFADQSHFTRTFRRLTGMTPGEYRRLRSTSK